MVFPNLFRSVASIHQTDTTDVRRTKVLYIAGPSRSGSTLLGNLLGELDGFFNAGELIDFWSWGLDKDGTCGCGEPFSKCSVWRGILSTLSGSRPFQKADAIETVRLAAKEIHSWKVPFWQSFPSLRTRMLTKLSDYHRLLQSLYPAIQRSLKCRVIVDGSKNAAYAYQLSQLPQIDLYILHLIRDPRATAFSWMRKKEALHQVGPLLSTAVWTSRNVVSAGLQRQLPLNYLRLRYEDFIRAPRDAVQEIIRFTGESPGMLPRVTDQQIELSTNHTIYGNPNRYQRGRIHLRADDQWRHGRWASKHLVTALTWPLLLKYGYSLRGQQRGRVVSSSDPTSQSFV